jgi:hypothetical protein
MAEGCLFTRNFCLGARFRFKIEDDLGMTPGIYLPDLNAKRSNMLIQPHTHQICMRSRSALHATGP